MLYKLRRGQYGPKNDFIVQKINVWQPQNNPATSTHSRFAWAQTIAMRVPHGTGFIMSYHGACIDLIRYLTNPGGSRPLNHRPTICICPVLHFGQQ